MEKDRAIAERLKDKAARLDLAFEIDYNVPRFEPLRIGVEFTPPASVNSDTLRRLEDLRVHIDRYTIRTYKPNQTIGNEPLLLDVDFGEALFLSHLALRAYSIPSLESIPSEKEPIFDNLRLRADATIKDEGYSFGREFGKLLSRNREGVALNVLFQEYINRDHAQRSGRIAFHCDGGGIYSYKTPEASLGPIVRDVDYSRRGVVSGTFSRLDQIEDEIMRSKVAQPLQTLVELFPWKQGVVVEFDYHSVTVGRRQERLIVYDFHEAEVTVQDITGSAAPR